MMTENRILRTSQFYGNRTEKFLAMEDEDTNSSFSKKEKINDLKQ